MNLRTVLKILALGALLAGCTQKGPVRRIHEAARPTVAAPEVKAEPAEVAQARGAFAEAGADPLAVARKMAPLVLDTATIEGADRSATQLTVARLNALNKALVRLGEKGDLTPEARDIAGLYASQLLAGCELKLVSCRHLKFFSQAASSAEVAKLLATMSAGNLDQYYRLLFIAFEIKNVDYDAQLGRLFITRSAEYMLVLTNDPRGSERLTRFSHVLSSLIASMAERGEPGDLRMLVDILQPLRTSAREFLQQSGVSYDALLKLMARSSGMTRDGAISPQVLAAIDESAKATDSFVQRQERVFAGGAGIAQQLEVQRLADKDENFFLIDQVYSGRLTSDQALLLWSSTSQSRARFAEVLRKYLRIQFLYSLMESTRLAQKFFFEKDVEGEEFFYHALRNASHVKPVWDDFLAKANLLQKFSLSALRAADERDPLVVESRRSFDGLARNIKFLSVYPQMMALAYHMSKKNFSLSFMTVFGRIEFTATNVIEKLFRAEFFPWFDYTTDESPLSSTELLYSFDFALRSGLFKIFRVDPDDYIAEITSRLSRDSSFAVQDYINLVERRMAGNNAKDMQALCAAVERGQSAARSVTLRDLKFYPLIGQLSQDMFQGVKNGGSSSVGGRGELAAASQGLFLYDMGFAEAAEQVRLDMWNTEVALKAMVKSYEAYLRHQPGGSLARTQEILREHRMMRAAFFTQAKDLYERVGRCYYKALNREQELQRKVIAAELAYLRQVHRDLLRLRAGEVSENKLQQQYALNGLPSGFRGLDHFAADGYEYNQVDFLLRMARHMRQGLITERAQIPPLEPRLTVNLGSRLDMDADLVNDSRRVLLPFTENEDEFVAQGLKVVLSDRSPFVSWLSLSGGAIANWGTLLHSLTVLYRAGEVEIFAPGCNAGTRKCGEGDLVKARIVDANDLIETHRQMLDIIRLTDDERAFFTMARLNKKFDPLMLSGRVLDYSVFTSRIRNTYGLFDYPVQLVTQEVLGVVFEIAQQSKDAEGQDPWMAGLAARLKAYRIGFKAKTQEFFRFRQRDNRQAFLFQVSPALDSYLDQTYSGRVRSEVQAVRQFEDALERRIGDYQKMDASVRPRTDISLSETIWEPMVTPTIYSSWETGLRAYDVSTDKCFLGQATCPAFQ